MFNGLGVDLGNLSRLSRAQTRSISPENFSGEKGKGAMSEDGPSASQARDLGRGWKISPYILIQPGETRVLADIEGSGAIRFERDLRVTIQALGWRSGGRYLPLQDDISSVAFWYQTLPAAPFPALPDADYLEVI